jgi:hypothetical protein
VENGVVENGVAVCRVSACKAFIALSRPSGNGLEFVDVEPVFDIIRGAGVKAIDSGNRLH